MNDKLQKEIDSVKASGLSVFRAKVGNKPYVYRSLSRSEYKDIQETLVKEVDKVTTEVDKATEGLEDGPEKDKALESAREKVDKELEKLRERSEDSLVNLAVLDPSLTLAETKKLPAGVVNTLSDLIMKASGFGVEAEPEEL